MGLVGRDKSRHGHDMAALIADGGRPGVGRVDIAAARHSREDHCRHQDDGAGLLGRQAGNFARLAPDGRQAGDGADISLGHGNAGNLPAGRHGDIRAVRLAEHDCVRGAIEDFHGGLLT